MSLLLDALKRAEQEKLARGDRPDLQVVGQGEGAAAAPSAQPSPAATGLELQPIGAAAPGSAGKPGQTPSKGQTPAQAQVVFQAKAAQQAAAEPKRGALYIAAAAITLAVIAAGAYVWYAMKSLSPAAKPAARLSPPAAPTPPPASGLPLPATAGGMAPFSPDAVKPAPGTSADAPASVVTTTTASAPPVASPAAPRPVPAATAEQLAQEALRDNAAQREPPLRLERTQEPARLSAEITGAYAALRQGDLAGARRGYQAALAADAANLDAHLGIATLEARAGNLPAAAAAYRRTLELDPRNETALAGMAALADAARPGAVEAQLRQDVMRHPQSAALHFALGNLLAAQARWGEAQGEYFEAHRLEPGSADIAHNLAVSLDRLGQARLAVDFYRRALEASRIQPGQFDPAPVERRLAELAR